MMQYRLETSGWVRALLAACVLILAASCRPNPSTPQARQALTDNLFKEWNQPDSPGCAVGIFQRGQIDYAAAYGMADLEHAVPITTRTRFYSGSLSKQLTAFVIALLEDQGQLSLNDGIRAYLPELPHYADPIQIRHLIYHTSGLRDYLTLWRLKGKNPLEGMNEGEVLNLIARQHALNFTPGERYMYSNSGYFLLSVIIKRSSGMSLRDFADHNIFQPLNMRDTHFHDNPAHIMKDQAEGYTRQKDGLWQHLPMTYALVGAGGVYTTIQDLFRWNQNLDHNTLGSQPQDLLEQTLEKGRLANGEPIDYAFGWERKTYRGLDVIRHGGALGGYRAHFLRIPAQTFTVALLCNTTHLNPRSLTNAVADIYLADTLSPREPRQEAKNRNPKSQKIPENTPPSDYTGAFVSDELQTIYAISAVNERLTIRFGQAPAQPMEPIGVDTFRVNRYNTITFQRNDANQVTHLNLKTWGVTRLRFDKS